jgi:hydrogenase-4 component E
MLSERLTFDIAHTLSVLVLLLSFALLYQRRLLAVFNAFAVQAALVAAAAAWQGYSQDAPHLYVTAGIALVFKATIIPISLRQIVRRLGIHDTIETVVGVNLALLAGVALVALSILLVFPVTETHAGLTRENLAIALSIVLIGLMMMITRRNAVTQVVGFMSMENGLVLAAVGVQDMPLVVEISVAFAVLIAFIVFGMFFFRIRERFDSLDLQFLESYRGDRPGSGPGSAA